MKNLGKIFLLFLLISEALNAEVVGSVDATKVQRGDVVTFSLKLVGEDVSRPNLYDICGVDVLSTSETRSMQMVNGSYTTDYILTYKFEPTKNCTVEPVEVKIDGKIEKTKAIDITVEKRVASKDDDFELQLFVTKPEVYVGEPFDLILMLKQKKSAKIVDNKFIRPELKGFWIKGEPLQERGEDDNYIVTKVTYSLSAQRVGTQDIEAAQMKIASRKNARNFFGGFFPEVKWKNYFSNELSIKVNPLPNDVSLVGDLKISARADKTTAKANEAINVTVEVSGDGNLEDIKTFKPYIDGVSVFDEKIAVEKNRLTQKIAFVGDSSFTIEPFNLRYFDIKTKKIKTIQTQPINIEILNAKVKQELTIERDENTTEAVKQRVVVSEEQNYTWIIIAFLLGILIGLIPMLIKALTGIKKKKTFSINDHKMLLVKLMPYKEHEDVKKIVDTLEKNLYSENKTKIDKKELKELVKKYEIA